MSDTDKIAAIEGILHDLAKLSAFLAKREWQTRSSAPTAPSEIVAAQAHALLKIADIAGIAVRVDLL